MCQYLPKALTLEINVSSGHPVTRNSLAHYRQQFLRQFFNVYPGSIYDQGNFTHVRSLPRSCPCGYFEDLKRECRCGPVVTLKYRQRISGPLLDRIDLRVDLPTVGYKTIVNRELTESSEAIRERVEKARAIQRERFKSERGVHTNVAMNPRLIRKHCEVDVESAGFLEHAMNQMNLSARAHDRILKVSRTLANLAASEKLQSHHVLEAINYRTLDRAMWS